MANDGAVKKKRLSKAELEEVLLNNFVNLQKVLTNLSLKFEDLSNNISKLLELFEISAKTFADKNSDSENLGGDIHAKIDSLLDQNKTIAKGIMLMEDKINKRGLGDNKGFSGSVSHDSDNFSGMTKSRSFSD